MLLSHYLPNQIKFPHFTCNFKHPICTGESYKCWMLRGNPEPQGLPLVTRLNLSKCVWTSPHGAGSLFRVVSLPVSSSVIPAPALCSHCHHSSMVPFLSSSLVQTQHIESQLPSEVCLDLFSLTGISSFEFLQPWNHFHIIFVKCSLKACVFLNFF